MPCLEPQQKGETFMEYRTLGRTGLRVSLAGLGTGGPSQLGQTAGLADSRRRNLA